MSSSVVIHVQGLGGAKLELQMEASGTVEDLRDNIAEAWSIDVNAIRLLVGPALLEDPTEITNVAPGDGAPLEVQLIKFDPLPNLGQFEQAHHRGIEIRKVDGKMARTVLVKTLSHPDSNNVFLNHPIREPCFVEFQVVRSRDEMSFGVTYEAESVAQASGYANLHNTTTWIYSKSKGVMPAFLFAGRCLRTVGALGFGEGDNVAVYVDPQERLVKFYKSRQFVASNLPDDPLPEGNGRPLRLYTMVDDTEDEVSVLRFGPGEPYR